MNKPGNPEDVCRQLERRVMSFARSNELISRGDRNLVVGVSGGPDSVCLLHVLNRIKEKLGISLHSAHLDHGLRGRESDADRAYVVELCERLGVPATVEKADLSYSRRRHSPLEETAREARYSFFVRTAATIGCETVAVGHTADDHVETVLLHLLRGAGTRGLSGLAPAVSWRREGKEAGLRVIRPLLEISRAETVAYCQALELRPRQDASNQSLDLLRNRVRLELLPQLRRYNPAVNSALARTARIARDEVEALDIWASEVWPQIARAEKGALTLDRRRISACPAGLQRHLLLKAMAEVLGDRRDIESSHIETLMGSLALPAGSTLNLLDGLTAHVTHEHVVLGALPPSPFPAMGCEYELTVPGETLVPGWSIVAEVMDRDEIQPLALPADGDSAIFDFAVTGPKLTLRSRRDGDRFRPLGMDHDKKIQDFMVDSHIPRHWRDTLPLVCSPHQVIWVAGFRISDLARVTEDTSRALLLRFRRTP